LEQSLSSPVTLSEIFFELFQHSRWSTNNSKGSFFLLVLTFAVDVKHSIFRLFMFKPILHMKSKVTLVKFKKNHICFQCLFILDYMSQNVTLLCLIYFTHQVGKYGIGTKEKVLSPNQSSSCHATLWLFCKYKDRL
jgi:hypothetical protein